MKRSQTSTPYLAGLATLALTAAALAVPMTSVTTASASVSTNASADDSRALAAASDKAARWIAKHEAKVKLAKQDKLVRTATIEGGNGTVSVAYERLHQGLPVIGGDFVVVTDGDGSVLNTEVAQTAPVDVASTTPALAEERAVEISRGQVDSVAGRRAHHAGHLAGRRHEPPGLRDDRLGPGRRARPRASRSTSTRRTARSSGPRST